MSDPVIIAIIAAIGAALNLITITGGAIISKILDAKLNALHDKVEVVHKEINGQSQALLEVTGKERYAAGQKQEKERAAGQKEQE